MHRLQPRGVHMRVDLRRGDAGVAEHLLHLAKIGPAAEHMRGETVPQRVRADFRVRRPGGRSVSITPKSARTQSPPT